MLGIVLAVWLCYRFIYIPQTEKLASLVEEKLELDEKITDMNNTLKKEEGINKEWKTLEEQKEEILGRYFPTLEQSEMIYLVNDLINDERVNVQDMTFDRPLFENINDLEVKCMDISMPYDGNYNGVMDIVKKMRTSPKKILVDEIVMDRTAANELSGTIGVKVYSLEGIVDTIFDSGIAVEKANNIENKEPFGKFASLANENGLLPGINDTGGIGVGGIGTGSNYDNKEVDPFTYVTLMDFETKSSSFLPSQPLIRGDVKQSTMSKSNKYSLRAEYHMLGIDEDKDNKAFIDVSRNNIDLKYPPEIIRMWMYSYTYSPITVGLEFKTQTGEIITEDFTEGINWTGWKQVELQNIPDDLSQYPLKLNSIFLKIPEGREDFGVILIDKLEALYNKNLDDDGNDNSVRVNYFYHVVDSGETVEDISEMYYGTDKYAKEILSLNELKAGQKLQKDRVLVLKRRFTYESVFETPKPKPVTKPATKSTNKPKATPKKQTVKIDSNAERFQHTVQKGETIYSISRKYYGTNSYAKEILQLNGINENDVLPVGKVLTLIKR